MRFPELLSQSEIDRHLAAARPRLLPAAPLPWGEAFIGLTLFMLLRMLG